MKELALIFLLVMSNCVCIFAMQTQYIYGEIQQKDIQFKGSRAFWKRISFPSQDGLGLQRLPHFQTNFTMQTRKRNGGSNSKAITQTREATTQLQSKSSLTEIQQKKERIAEIEIRIAEINRQKAELSKRYREQVNVEYGLQSYFLFNSSPNTTIN